MIDAQRSEAIEWNVADKGLKGLAQYVEAAIEIEMLGIDVGDDRDRRRQSCKGAVALVGLDHHPIARSQSGRAARSRAACRSSKSSWSCRGSRRLLATI